MWSLKVIILLLFCYACLSTHVEKVWFESKNFINMLRWKAAMTSLPEQKVLYTVQYWRFDHLETYSKTECHNITALECDLTAETPPHPDTQYYAKVYANGQDYGNTSRFNPITDTILGQPSLDISVTSASLRIHATLPLGPNGASVADIISRMRGVNCSIRYTFKITNPKRPALEVVYPTAHFVISSATHPTNYCGYVLYTPLCERGRLVSENTTFCATPTADLTVSLPWILTGTTLLIVIILMSTGGVCVYMKGAMDKKLPHSLIIHPAKQQPNLQHTPERNPLISPAIITTQSQKIYNYVPIRTKTTGHDRPRSSHSLHEIPSQPPTERASSNHSSIIYSSVEPATPNKLSTVLVKDAEQLLSPLQGKTCKDEDPGEQLQIRTTRDTNGKLKLASLHFCVKALQSTMKDSDGAQLNRLNSSESADSGCVDEALNIETPTHSEPLGSYLCNNVPRIDVNPTSEYKQNWIPLDTHIETQDYMSRNPSWSFSGSRESEKKQFTDNAEMPATFLESWALQIQD
ncbi:interferon lambda receptor 1 isoform X2 [Stigmatopora nigra]